MKLLRRGEGRAVRWKNGGGVTHELAVWPEGADLSGFDARLSMAEVAAEGPFSAFPGIDRTLAVLAGGPLRLSFGGAEVVLTAKAPPLSFPGEAPVHAALEAGPVLDLNMMTRRGACAHRMTRLAQGDRLPDGTVALVARGEVSVAGFDLAAGDALLGQGSVPLQGLVDRGQPLAVILDCLENRQDAGP